MSNKGIKMKNFAELPATLNLTVNGERVTTNLTRPGASVHIDFASYMMECENLTSDPQYAALCNLSEQFKQKPGENAARKALCHALLATACDELTSILSGMRFLKRPVPNEDDFAKIDRVAVTLKMLARAGHHTVIHQFFEAAASKVPKSRDYEGLVDAWFLLGFNPQCCSPGLSHLCGGKHHA